MTEERVNEYPVEQMIVSRWSPRAMSGEPITQDELYSLFEAARWAPSSYNNQPWRFHYAMRDTEGWEAFFSLLVPFNQSWTKDASALIIVASKKTFDDGTPSATHTLDTGAAWENLALQGFHSGLVVHGMQGFDYEKAHELVGLSDEYAIEMMIAVGKPGPVSRLPEGLAEREIPSPRKPVSEFVVDQSRIQNN